MSNGNNKSLKPYPKLTSEMFDDDDAELGEVDSSLAAFAMPDGLTLQERLARQATQRELRNRSIETALLAAGTQALRLGRHLYKESRQRSWQSFSDSRRLERLL